MGNANNMINALGGMAEQALFRQQASNVAQSRSLSTLDGLRAGNRGTSPAATRAALREASKQFEAVFLNQMLKVMRQTVGDGGLIKKSQGEEIFEGMLDEEWSKSMAGRYGPNGLSEILYRQLERQMGLEPATEIAETSPRTGADLPHPLMATTALPSLMMIERTTER